MTHIIIPSFDALGEAPLWDACGPVADEVCFAAHYGIEPQPARVAAARQRMINQKLFRPGQGCTINELNTEMVNNLSLPTTLYPAGTNLSMLYTAMHTATLNKEPVILNLANAGALKGNEKKVLYHFIAIGGIDDGTDMGYLIADGDQLDDNGNVRTSPYVPLYWATWSQILVAQPFAAIVVHR